MNTKIYTVLRASLGVVSLALVAFANASELAELQAKVDSQSWEEAKLLGESLTASEPENGEAYYFLGKAYSNLGDKQGAVKAFSQATKFKKDNADYFSDYAYALILRAQDMNMFKAGPTYMRALDQYKEAVKIDPDHVVSHIGLARYYMNAPSIAGGSMKKAKEHAAEVARINPYLGHIENGLIAQKEKRVEDAISEFEGALSMRDEEVWIRFELGKLLVENGKPSEAQMAFEAVLDKDPNHQGASEALAKLSES